MGFQAQKPLDGRDTIAHNPHHPSRIRIPGMTDLRIAKAAVALIGVSWK
jgi:hypothetical protein